MTTPTSAPRANEYEERLERQTPPDRFQVLLLDPPWATLQKGALGAIRHYDLLSVEQIKRMAPAIKALSAPNAHLYLWVTNATLRDGYEVMEAFGFTPRTGPLTWVKPRLGLGGYLRNATEHVLFGTRGSAPVKYRAQPTWAFWPLLDHSTKPDELYAVIDRLSGRDAAKLELFARRRPPAPNWWVWGNEIESDVSLAQWGYPVPSDFARQDGAAPAAPPRPSPTSEE
jgi:N6-adenosine-specific RNA methylase IME4